MLVSPPRLGGTAVNLGPVTSTLDPPENDTMKQTTSLLTQISLDKINELFEVHKEIGECDNGFTNPAYGLSQSEFKIYIQSLIDESMGLNLKPGYVPQTTFVMLVENNIVGLSRLRHKLNDYLLNDGGNIGYYIAKKYRGFGLGNVILLKTLDEARIIGLDRVLLTVDINNLISKKVILRNGGLLEKESNGKSYFWVKLKMV